MANFFAHGGGKVFISTTFTTTREIQSYTHRHCVLVKDWNKAVEELIKLVKEKQFHGHFDSIEMFTTPRLCDKCLAHATQPLMFENAKCVEECLCYIERIPCGIHKERI